MTDAEYIKRLAIRSGVSPADLARYAGLSTSVIKSAMQGQRSLRADVYSRLGAAGEHLRRRATFEIPLR